MSALVIVLQEASALFVDETISFETLPQKLRLNHTGQLCSDA